MSNHCDQEAIYRAKVNMNARVTGQIRQISTEVSLHKQLKQLQKMQQQQLARIHETDDNISRMNAVKLMRRYERLHVHSEKKLKDCESRLEVMQKLAERYHNLYLNEKNEHRTSSQGGSSRPKSSDGGASSRPKSSDGEGSGRPKSGEAGGRAGGKNKGGEGKGGKRPASGRSDMSLLRMLEADLDDDKARFTRQVARMIDSGSLALSGPIRVEDVIRKNEVLILENEKLRNEVERLKYDNAQLLLKCKHAGEDRAAMMNHMATSDANREELLERLNREQRKYDLLNKSLTQTTSEWIQAEQESEQAARMARHKRAQSCSVSGAEARTFMHHPKKNTDKPKQMFPVEKYATANQH